VQGLCNGRVSVRLSVCLSRRSTASAASGGRGDAAAVISIDSCGRAVGAVQQAPALSSKCGQRHVESRQRRLDTDLVYTVSRVVFVLSSVKRAFVLAEGLARRSRRRRR